MHVDESALPSLYLGCREHWRFFTLHVWVRSVDGSGDEKLMYASLACRNETSSRRVKEYQAYIHDISRKTNLFLYHTMNVYGGFVVTFLQKYTQEILVTDQLNTQIIFLISLLYIYLYVSSTMHPSSGGQIVLYSICYPVHRTATRRYQMLYNTI